VPNGTPLTHVRMIIDFEQARELELSADVCIVGAGATGLALAHALAGRDTRVVVVESGGPSATPQADSLNSGESVGAQELELEASRARGIGGTTQLWAGQCVPFEVDDFVRRDWVPHAEWPFERAELEPFYRQAEGLLGLPPSITYDESAWQPFDVQPAAVDPALLRHRCTVMPHEVHMGHLTAERLNRASNVTLLLNATATEVLLDEAGERTSGLELRSLSGRRARLSAPVVALCAGAIENARLLLLSRSRRERGLGNGHDQVGRWLQDHPNAYAATVERPNARFLQDRYGLLYGRRARWFPRLALSADAARRQEALQSAAVVSFEYPHDSAVTAVRRIVRGAGRRRSARALLERPGTALRATRELVHIAWRRYAKGLSPALAPSRISLQVFTEQAPDPERRVTLGERRDPLGLPVAQVDWEVGQREVEATAALVSALRHEFDRLGIGRVSPEPWLEERDASAFRDAFHHIGTTRMSADPRNGVVDPDLQVHDVPGLYCAGASSFPSSSWANPVLTAVATTLRLADRLGRNGEPR
jgi:choline dehydrogenase-like flavoprotein